MKFVLQKKALKTETYNNSLCHDTIKASKIPNNKHETASSLHL